MKADKSLIHLHFACAYPIVTQTMMCPACMDQVHVAFEDTLQSQKQEISSTGTSDHNFAQQYL